MAGHDVGFCVVPVSERESDRSDDGNLKKKLKTHIGVESGDDSERLLSSNQSVDQEPMTESVGQAEKNCSTKPSIVDGTCYINRLPLEILDMILSYLSRRVRKNVRLVCRLWYDRGHFDDELYVYDAGAAKPDSIYRCFQNYQYLENCGFKRLDLRLYRMEIPVSIWNKIGVRIHSLKLSGCRLGNLAVENIFSHCENLQVLKVHLASFDLNESFCSLETLQKLNVVQKMLHTLEICHTAFCLIRIQPEVGVEKWKQIFRELRRIFPNVKCYCSGAILPLCEWKSCNIRFKMEFPIESASKVEESDLIVALANSMSVFNEVDWRRALQALSTLSLTSVSLFLGRKSYERDDADAFINFFASHKELKRINLKLGDEELNVFRNADLPRVFSEILVSILFHILEKCTQLREFYYWNDWFSRLNETQYVQLVSKTSRLSKFVVGNLLIEDSRIEVWHSFDDGSACTVIRALAPYYPHLQHLILRDAKISYQPLQSIFKYMINLKTLEISLCTLSSCPKDWTYSLKRLQNLERLKIYALEESTSWNRDLYNEFEFPKLRYLYCILPEEASTLDCIGTKMPALREVDFSQTDCTKPDFNGKCPSDILQGVDMTRIFANCPTLQSLHYYRGTYFYEPFTQKVIFTKK